MRRLLLIISLLVSYQPAFSQDLRINCGERKIPCDNGNKSHFEMVINHPYKETDTTKIPKLILDNSKKYLLDRVGNNFYNKLKYYACETVTDKKIKYDIEYFFEVQDSMRYYISLVFDKNGNILSKHFLPDMKQNKNFDIIINVCEAVKIAEADSVYSGKVEVISLEYSEKENSFIWVVQKPNIYKEKNRVIEPYLYLNANTGKLIKRKTATGTICYLPSF